MNLLLVPVLLPVALMLAVLAMEKFEHWALKATPKDSDGHAEEWSPAASAATNGSGVPSTSRQEKSPHLRPLPPPPLPRLRRRLAARTPSPGTARQRAR